jgi:hypothetical protein
MEILHCAIKFLVLFLPTPVLPSTKKRCSVLQLTTGEHTTAQWNVKRGQICHSCDAHPQQETRGRNYNKFGHVIKEIGDTDSGLLLYAPKSVTGVVTSCEYTVSLVVPKKLHVESIHLSETHVPLLYSSVLVSLLTSLHSWYMLSFSEWDAL